jgi:hypothetical protein
MWRLLQCHSIAEFENDITAPCLAAWYIQSANERQVAQATLIGLLKPRLNRKQEGEPSWTLRPPDVAGVPFPTLNRPDRAFLAIIEDVEWPPSERA